MADASRACACCFALSLLGLMRMLSKNFDESIGMADYDNAMRKASSLDIAKPLTPDAPLTTGDDGRIAAAMTTHETVKDIIIHKLREAFAPESLEVLDESHLHEGHAGHRVGGETHFRVYLVCRLLLEKKKIERHHTRNTALT